MEPGDATSRSLREQLADVRTQLEEAEETLAALRDGDVDAIVINEKLFVLEGSDTASNHFRGNVLARVSDAVIALDSDHRITYVNTSAERQFRMSAPQVLGRTLESVLGVQSWLDPSSAAQEALRECGTWRGELERTRDHELLSEELSLTALFDANGIAEGFLAIVRDITERKKTQAERELLLKAERLARADAEAANHAKSDFLAVMSHELRTPLNAIYGYAQLIEMGIRGPVTQAQHDDLLRIQRSQRHLLGLIEGVLTYAKLDAGAMEYHLGRVPVQEVIATCEALVLPQILEKHITFHVVRCDTILAARADYEKTKQVIINLLSNAVKFTDEGGVITVECVLRHGHDVQIEVTDTGRGISADQLEAVFQPFVQLGVNSTLTRTATGTGLGLSISRELAIGMGGSLQVRSELGIGSTFTLTLPAFE